MDGSCQLLLETEQLDNDNRAFKELFKSKKDQIFI
jgi:hypothetical protein